MGSQCPEKAAADAWRRQLIAVQEEIRILKKLEEEKSAEN